MIEFIVNSGASLVGPKHGWSDCAKREAHQTPADRGFVEPGISALSRSPMTKVFEAPSEISAKVTSELRKRIPGNFNVNKSPIGPLSVKLISSKSSTDGKKVFSLGPKTPM